MNNLKKKRISIYIIEKNYSDLQVIAKLNDLSVSNVINRLFADYVKNFKGIELAVIDVSGAKYLTKKWKETYWNEVNSILKPLSE